MLEGIDAIVNLAGKNVHGRWTDKKKQKILSNRIQSTTLLAKSIAQMKNPPRVFVSASGVTYYGNKIPEPVDETCTKGTDFLALVSRPTVLTMTEGLAKFAFGPGLIQSCLLTTVLCQKFF